MDVPGQRRPDPLVRVLISASSIRSSALARGRVLFALSAGERVLLAVVLVMIVLIRLLLWVLASRTSLRLVRRLAALGPRAARAVRPPAERLAWMVSAASRVVPRATCLTQAVAGQLLLRHYGYDSSLCLGVAKSTSADFLAHAWIEHDQRVLVGGGYSGAFVRLPALRSKPRRVHGAETR